MKKIILLSVLLLFAITTFAQQGVKWETGNFQEALTKAQSNKKGPKQIFMDCYTTWCGPCKYMANTIFPTKEAGEYFNKNFINIKIDMEKGEGIELAKKFNIKAYPTFLILDEKGNEVGRIVGGDELTPFIKKVDRSKNPDNNPEIILSKYKETKDPKYAYDYLETLSDMYMESKIVDFFDEYYSSLKDKDKYSEKTWKYVKGALSFAKPKTLNTIIDNKWTYDMYFGKAAVDEALTNAIKSNLNTFLMGKETVSPEIIDKACGTLELLSERTYFQNFIISAAKAYAKQDMKTIMNLFDARILVQMYAPRECSMAQRIFLEMKNVSKVEKARFVKEFREAYEQLIKRTDKTWDEYKDIEIPLREENSRPAMIML